MKTTPLLVRSLLLALVTAVGVAPSSAVAQSAPSVVGKTVGEWAAVAVTSYFAQPYSVVSPCGARAKTGPVWILWPSSTAPGTYEHDCTLPREVHLLVGIADAFWIQTPLDDPSFTEEDWRELAQAYFGYFFPVIDIKLELDGRPVVFDPRTPIVRTQTPVFRAQWNADNMFGLDPAAYLNGFPVVDEGYWAILMPLSPGQHVLKISPNSTLERTYHLTVR